jgi:hypothetical protein
MLNSFTKEKVLPRTQLDNQFILSTRGQNKFEFKRVEVIYILSWKWKGKGKTNCILCCKITNYESVNKKSSLTMLVNYSVVLPQKFRYSRTAAVTSCWRHFLLICIENDSSSQSPRKHVSGTRS